jgi:hypothetical protein
LNTGTFFNNHYIIMKTKGPNLRVSRAFGLISPVQELNAMKRFQNPISPLNEAGFRI